MQWIVGTIAFKNLIVFCQRVADVAVATVVFDDSGVYV